MSRIIPIFVGICIISLPILYHNSESILANELASTLFVFFMLLIVGIQLIYDLFKRNHKTVSINIVDILLTALFFYCLFCMLASKTWEADKYVIYKWGAVILCYIFFRNYHYTSINLLIACCISGMLQSVISICQKTGLLSSHHVSFDVTGSFNNPGPLGGYIAICSMITMGLLYYAIKTKQIITVRFLLVGLLIQFYGLYLTESRAAILSLIPGCLYFIFSSESIKKKTEKYKKQLFIIICLMLIIGGLFIYQSKPASADGRLLIWQVSANMITDAPFFGHGIDSFSKEYMMYQANYFKENPASYFTSVADNTVYPFNEFIHIWINYGIVGLLLTILLFYFVFINSNKSAENKIIKVGLSSLLIFSLFSYPLAVFPLLLFFPFLCGLIHSEIYYRFKITVPRQILIILIIIILLIQTPTDALFLKNISNSLLTLHEKGGSDINPIDYTKIKRNTNFNDYYATWLIQQSNTQNERIKDMYPSCEAFCLLGRYYVEHKDYQLAEYYFQEASFMIPTRLRPKYSLWELYKDTEQHEKALEVANTILTMDLKIESTYTLRMKRRVKDYYK